ncbi:MAG: hypothetical protein V3U73_08835 [bacterium]
MQDSESTLTPKEEKFLARQIRNVKNYLYFSIAGIAAAVGLLAYSILTNTLNGTKFALIIVLLLAARGNLKQHKDARLLIKFKDRDKDLRN